MPSFYQPCGHHVRFHSVKNNCCSACKAEADRADLEPDADDFLVDNRMPPALLSALGGLASLFPPKQVVGLRDITLDQLEDFSACPLSELNGFDADFMEVEVEWLKRVVKYLCSEHKNYDAGCDLADAVMVPLGHHLEVASL